MYASWYVCLSIDRGLCACCVPAQDLVYYMRMFTEDMKRNPTNVELFDIAQSNSEHRHVRCCF